MDKYGTRLSGDRTSVPTLADPSGAWPLFVYNSHLDSAAIVSPFLLLGACILMRNRLDGTSFSIRIQARTGSRLKNNLHCHPAL